MPIKTPSVVTPSEPVRTESYALSYAKADDLRKMFTDKDQRILSKRGTATIDERTDLVGDLGVAAEQGSDVGAVVLGVGQYGPGLVEAGHQPDVHAEDAAQLGDGFLLPFGPEGRHRIEAVTA